MSVFSMTGFARADGSDAMLGWTWEVKSVNGRSLDVRCRLPPGLDSFEPTVRRAVGQRFGRGHFSVSLRLAEAPAAAGQRVNRAWLDALIALAREYRDTEGVLPPRLDGLLGLRGVIESVDEDAGDSEARTQAMAATLDVALDLLAEARRAEGARLNELVEGQLAEIDKLTGDAADYAAAHPELAGKRLRERLAALLDAGTPVPEERLAQELALLATKADVREELDRLAAHRAAAAEQLAAGGTVGRRLDFLAQELNREANTLCAKADDIALTEIGLALKAVIDRFREQVQNIE